MTHDYVRNGTTSLFAALDLASASVIAQHYSRHRHQEFLHFLKLIDDAGPREITVPGDLAEALVGDPAAHRFFDSLAFTYRKEWVRWSTEAKKAETRSARISKALRSGKRSH